MELEDVAAKQRSIFWDSRGNIKAVSERTDPSLTLKNSDPQTDYYSFGVLSFFLATKPKRLHPRNMG